MQSRHLDWKKPASRTDRHRGPAPRIPVSPPATRSGSLATQLRPRREEGVWRLKHRLAGGFRGRPSGERTEAGFLNSGTSFAMRLTRYKNERVGTLKPQ